MTYQVDFPPDVERRLSERANETGHDVVHVIRTAVMQFVGCQPSAAGSGDNVWSEALDARRCELIDKDIAGTITESEISELASLETLANEHFDRIAPPPLDAARRLHQQLLSSRGRLRD
jgi:hypothetical protein